MDYIRSREHTHVCVFKRNKLTMHLLVLSLTDFRLPGVCHRFAVDRASHVCHRPILCFPFFRDQTLMDDFSMAIWNKNRVVVAISLGVWTANVAFLIQGESGCLSQAFCMPGISYKRV